MKKRGLLKIQELVTQFELLCYDLDNSIYKHQTNAGGETRALSNLIKYYAVDIKAVLTSTVSELVRSEGLSYFKLGFNGGLAECSERGLIDKEFAEFMLASSKNKFMKLSVSSRVHAAVVIDFYKSNREMFAKYLEFMKAKYFIEEDRDDGCLEIDRKMLSTQVALFSKINSELRLISSCWNSGDLCHEWLYSKGHRYMQNQFKKLIELSVDILSTLFYDNSLKGDKESLKDSLIKCSAFELVDSGYVDFLVSNFLLDNLDKLEEVVQCENTKDVSDFYYTNRKFFSILDKVFLEIDRGGLQETILFRKLIRR